MVVASQAVLLFLKSKLDLRHESAMKNLSENNIRYIFSNKSRATMAANIADRPRDIPRAMEWNTDTKSADDTDLRLSTKSGRSPSDAQWADFKIEGSPFRDMLSVNICS